MEKKLRRALVLVLCCLVLPAAAAMPLVSGDFSGEADGFSSTIPIKVTLTLEAGVITNALVTGEGEHARIAAEALERLPELMVQRNSVDLEAVTGATWTSRGIMSAARQALEKARMVEIAAGNGQNGPLTASGSAFGWSTTHPIVVSITVEEGRITAVDVKAEGEHATIGMGALEQLQQKVIAQNSIAVDNITGATWTSAGFLAAAQSAMNRMQLPYAQPDILTIHDFKTLRWGDQEEAVLALEGEPAHEGSVKGQDLRMMSFDDQLAGLDMELTYHFTARQLFRARYQSLASHSSIEDYIKDYESIKRALTESHGKPIDDRQLWLKTSQRKEAQNKGAALFRGDLVYQTRFEKDRTAVTLHMQAIDYQVLLRVVFQDMMVSPEEGGY